MNSKTYNTYNRIRAYLFQLLNAKFGTEKERIGYFSSFISNHDFDSILDLGCGRGSLLDAITESTKSKLLVGVDLIKNQQDLYQHVVADATRLPFKNDAFSFVTAFSLIEHIPKEKRKMFYKEARRVIRKGGRFVVQLPNRYFIVESHTYLPFFGFLSSSMHLFAYRGGYVAVPSLKSVIRSLKEYGFWTYDVKKYEGIFLPFGSFLSKLGLYHFLPMGYIVYTQVS
ncbi:MAG: class I SAM-dependent methyltransferase [Candidatus Bathyarchaeota archaeon]|nr:class I SAM-dependent methyltransferase [Candidatus Bathyarchaeota archaeon]MDH5788306.1 class I SAM-dependent methyltransferase [Candidatus Bathyarchaeota archaeon]